jgi:hypothetical protein
MDCKATSERGLWSSLTIEKKDWRGVGRKAGGQLSTKGVKLYSYSLHWAGQACVCMEETW